MAEPTTRLKRPQVEDPVKERDDWRRLLDELIRQVQAWIQPEWSTRVIEKEMFDAALGRYHAPALLMQREIPRLILEPITRFPLGADGAVDLYLMPAYDDIAKLLRVAGRWDLYYTFRGEKPVVGTRNNPALPLNEENFLRVMESIGGHAV